MANIRVSCDFCGRTFTVPSTMAGETATCECGSAVQVPESSEGAQDISEIEPLDESPDAGEAEGAPADGWYVNVDGTSEGPKTLNELKRSIERGEVKKSQKVYQESFDEWQTISSLSYLTSDFVPEPPDTSVDSGDRKWYVRVGGSKYGPYDNDRVQKMLQKNQLRPDSQIWSSELGEWKDVQNVEPFASNLSGGASPGSASQKKDASSASSQSQSPSAGKNVNKEETTKEETTRNETTTRSKRRKKETSRTGLTTNLKGLFQRGGKASGKEAQVPSTVLTVEYVDDTEGIETYLKDIVRTLEALQEQTDQVQQYVSRLARAVNQQKKQNQESMKALRRRLDRLYKKLEERPAPPPAQEVSEEPDTGEALEQVDEEFGVPEEYSNDDAHQRAWQVAEVMASDLEAYHPDEVEEGVMYDNLQEVLEDSIAEARETYEERTPERVREEVDYFDMALRELVARKKSEMDEKEVS